MLCCTCKLTCNINTITINTILVSILMMLPKKLISKKFTTQSTRCHSYICLQIPFRSLLSPYLQSILFCGVFIILCITLYSSVLSSDDALAFVFSSCLICGNESMKSFHGFLNICMKSCHDNGAALAWSNKWPTMYSTTIRVNSDVIIHTLQCQS